VAQVPLTVATKEDFPGHLSILLGKGGGDEGPCANGRVGWKAVLRLDTSGWQGCADSSRSRDRDGAAAPLDPSPTDPAPQSEVMTHYFLCKCGP
jgi:hypothetical protein